MKSLEKITLNSVSRSGWGAHVPGMMVLSLFVLSGCGRGGDGNAARWQGEVTIGGKPLPAGTQGAITFKPADKEAKPITVPLNEGKFDSPQVPMGKVKAYFSLSKPTGKMLHSDRTGEDYEETVNIVPRTAQAGVDLEVAGDKSDVKIDL